MLGYSRGDVENEVEAETNNSRTILPRVKTWLDDVNKIIEEKEMHFKEEAVAKAMCCNGWFPNLKSRRALGRKGKKMTVHVDDLLRDGNFPTLAYRASPPRIGSPTILPSQDPAQALTKPHEGASSSGTSNIAPPPAAAPLELSGVLEYKLPDTKEVFKAVQDDNINMIGISGVIKGEDIVTVEEFIGRVKQLDLFEDSVMIVMSSSPDLRQIQGEIADMLGLSLENGSLLERAEVLRAQMSMDSKRYLLIFVDIKKMINLEDLGVPCADNNKICKVVMTSRLPNVFNDLRTQRNFKFLWADTSMEGPTDFESRNNLIIRDVMHALMDNQINPIVICGMGGIGKTTLAEEVGKRARAGGLFDEVAIAVFTQKLDLSRIQDEIAEFLGLELTENSPLGRAHRLRKRLSGTKRVLLILDNVSTEVNLEKLGIPSPRDKTSCKILVTSRKQNIFNNMDTKMNFPIDVLTEQEAWDLFKEMAGYSIEYDPVLRLVARQVLSKCAGLPIAIKTVGRALQGKSIVMWKNALRQLTRACPENIPGMIQEVYPKIELSYQCLESHEAKSCFLLCCLYPESSNIPVEDLVRYGGGLKLFKGINSMEEERNNIETLVDILKSCYLLLDSNKEGCVRMHDVVRDAALSIGFKSRDGLVVRYGVELNDWPNKDVSGRYISSTLLTNKTPELLLLSCTDEYSLIPPATIFKGMENLKVLGIKNTFLLSILPSLPFLENLQALCLEHCNLNMEIGPVIGMLRKLMTLSLRGSYIEKLPDEFENLINLRVLDLTGCKGLKIISPCVISRLSLLEELYMWDSYEKRVIGDQAPAEILQDLHVLRYLNTLEIVLPPINNLLHTGSLLFRGLVRFKISIGSIDKKWDVNPCHNYLRLHDLDAEFSLVDADITVLLKKTHTLELKMKNLKDPLNDLDREGLVNLESLTIDDCNALEYLIRNAHPINKNEILESDTLVDPKHMFGSIRTRRRIFPVLNSLKINGARSMKEICHGELEMGSFEELRQLFLSNLPALTHLWKLPTHFNCLENLGWVEVRSCDSLESLFLFSVAGGLKILNRLEEVDIKHCRYMKEIVALEGSGSGDEANEIKFHNLIRLNLQDLPSLIGISKNMYKMNFPQLITLKLQQLPELISLCPNSSATDEGSSNAIIQHLFDPKVKSFGELRLMVVDSCEKISGVFSTNLVHNLQNLERLEVRDCVSLKTVFDFEDLKITRKKVDATLYCLEKLELTNLPLLEYVWKPPHNILAFQNLRMLQVMRCMALRYVFPLFVVEGLVKLESIYVSDCSTLRSFVDKNEGEGDGEATNIVLPQVKTLHLDNVPNFITFCPAPCTVEWPSLITLVLCCPTMRSFVPSFEAARNGKETNDENLQFQSHIFDEKMDLPVLETLEIRQMYNFKGIWNSQVPPHSFCELKYLTVSDCSRLSCLVPMYMQTRLQKLEKLKVTNCYLLEEVFEFKELNANEANCVTISESGEADAPSTSQPQGMQINMMGSKITPGCKNLTSLYISGCNNLRNLISPSIARGLENLNVLSVCNCLKMEEIITAEGEGTEHNSMLPQLRYLELSELACLTSFCQGIYTFEWPVVETIIVDECPEMKKFCLGSLSTPWEVKLSVNGTDESLLQELKDSRKEPDEDF